MALLRNYARLWAKTVRPMSTNLRYKPERLMGFNEDNRSTPRFMRAQSNLMLNDHLRANKTIDRDGWLMYRKDTLASSENDVKEATVDMVIVHLCLDNGKTDMAMEYLQYLWDSDHEMNLSSMISYFKLCYTEEINETRLKYLLNMYNKIRDKYTVLDALTAECCIMGITQTNRWKESFELMDIIKLSCKPRSVPYTAIIVAAFNNNEPEIGFKYLREVLARLNPDHKTYLAFVQYCTRNFKDNQVQEEISKMFHLWGDSDVRPYIDVMSEYENVLSASGWKSNRTSITAKGVCTNCSHQLSSLDITPEQYKKLTDAVRERVIIGNDVYQKSSPEELKRFLSFIERARSYDIVIDGLNVSYVTRPRERPDGEQLTQVIELCVKMGKKVLVLGRKHMFKWPRLNISLIKKHGSLFLADNSSADDPYLLYATLISGPNTQFISKDLMRQHKFLIEDPELIKIFKYWQMSHQIYPSAIRSNRETQMVLRNPPIYLPVAQKDNDGWHVPYTLDSSLQPALVYEPPKSWVCFREQNLKTSG